MIDIVRVTLSCIKTVADVVTLRGASAHDVRVSHRAPASCFSQWLNAAAGRLSGSPAGYTR